MTPADERRPLSDRPGRVVGRPHRRFQMSGSEAGLGRFRRDSRCVADRGAAAAVSVGLFVPLLLVIASLAVVAGRMSDARAEVTATARIAARQATLAPDFASAEVEAASAADANLGSTSDVCETFSVSLAGSDWSLGGAVSATVTCRVTWTDLGPLPAGSHSVTVVATATEAISPHRTLEAGR